MSGILGLGIDVTDVAEVERILAARAGKSFLAKTFTRGELAYAKGDPEKIATLFAAKEAAFKAFGTGWIDGKLVEVKHARSGAPRLALHGKLDALARTLRVTRIDVSLSRTKRTAVAAVVLSG